MNNFIDYLLNEVEDRENTDTRRNSDSNSVNMPRDAEMEAAFVAAQKRHKSTAAALTMALKKAEDARKEEGVTKAQMSPLILRVKTAQEKYEEAALDVIAFSETEDPTEDPDVKTYTEKMEKYHDRVDAFLASVEEFTDQEKSKKKKNDDTEYLKIPYTKLTDFDGSDPSKFKAWFATHKQCVAANPNVPQIQKYLHLHNSLKGKALEVIEGLPFDDSNYEEAKRLLENRYASKRSLAVLISTLNRVAPLTAYKAKDQRHHLSLLLSLHRAIKHHDKLSPQSDYPMLFMPIVKEKLPSFFIRKYEEEHGKCDDAAYAQLTVDHLLQQYQVSVEAQEVMEGTLPAKEEPKKEEPKTDVKKTNNKRWPRKNDGQLTIEDVQKVFATLTTKNNQAKGGSTSDPPKCIECDGAHFASNCPTDMPNQQRVKKIKAADCCINCKGRFHSSDVCRKPHACTKCKDLPKHATNCHQ